MPPLRRAPHDILARLAALATEDLEPDMYGEGEVIASFEREIAGLLGKEAAVFMPSGTMAQPIALRIWSERRRCATVAFHPRCHLELHEEKGYQRLHGLHAWLCGEPSALMTLADLERIAEPIAALLIELPQREIGGLLPTWDELSAIAAWARARGAALHLDGARLWESQPFYGRPLAEIAGLFDSVYVSTYKTLGGIAGCLLAGTVDFIREARVWQRRQGGNLPALWPYVLASRAGFEERLPRIPLYVAKARALALRLASIPGIEVNPSVPPTNMFHLHLRADRRRLDDAALDIAEATGVWMFARAMGTDSPLRQRVEITCGDATLELEDEEIAKLFASLMERAV
ncbi:Low-specificity L-threonine aldolase [Minicystis rosea]|nr:Low-specificity L-threonine aldolase [Minicystis rosea]